MPSHSSLPQPTPFPPRYIYKILPSSFFPIPLPPSSHPPPPSSSSSSSSSSPLSPPLSHPTSSLPLSLPLLPLDLSSGYIHLSTSAQLLNTLNLFFKEEESVWMLRVPYERVEGFVKWEDGEGRVLDLGSALGLGGGVEDGRKRTAYFPHLYGNERGGLEKDGRGFKIGRAEVDAVRLFEKVVSVDSAVGKRDEEGTGGEEEVVDGEGRRAEKAEAVKTWTAEKWPWGGEDRPTVLA